MVRIVKASYWYLGCLELARILFSFIETCQSLSRLLVARSCDYWSAVVLALAAMAAGVCLNERYFVGIPRVLVAVNVQVDR